MYSVNVRGTSTLLAAAISEGVRRWVQLTSVTDRQFVHGYWSYHFNTRK